MIVLIPAYQPDGALVDLVAEIRSAAPDLGVLVVDDGSGPDYRAIFAAVSRSGAQVIGHQDNRGKGSALKTGLRRIASENPGEDVVCADADGQHTVADILRVADRVRLSDASMVLGVRRFTGPVPLRSRIGNTLTRWLFQLATRHRIADTQTGLRGYPAEMLDWLAKVDGDRYDYELNLLLRATAQGQRIDTVDIATIYLPGNESSHFRPLVDSARIYGRLLTFALSSLAAFLLDTVLLLVLNAVTGSLLVSVVGARAISSTVNFATNRTLVFSTGRDRSIRTAAALYFSLVAVLAGINYLMILGLTGVGLALLPAKIVTEIALFAVSYQAQRRVVFTRRRADRASTSIAA